MDKLIKRMDEYLVEEKVDNIVKSLRMEYTKVNKKQQKILNEIKSIRIEYKKLYNKVSKSSYTVDYKDTKTYSDLIDILSDIDEDYHKLSGGSVL